MQFQIPSNVPNNLKGQVFDARKLLPVNKNFPNGWLSKNPPRDLAALTTIVIHHDALSKASSKSYSDIDFAKRVATSHINSKHNIPQGDPTFPYHLWCRNGVVYVCNDLEAFTYGVASNNSYTVHICVSGNYAGLDTLEDRDRNALYAAILMVKSLVPSITTIKGHREITPTACPGFDVNQVRNDIAAIESTMKLSSELDNSQNAQTAKIYAAYGRFTDLYKLATTTNPNQAEAQRKVNFIIDAMVEHGILKQ
jgi:hypothetical protein